MYLRRIDEYEYRNDNRRSSHSVLCAVCSSFCVCKHEQTFGYRNYYHYYCCPICGTLYYKVFNRSIKSRHNNYVIQICFDDDHPELDIIQRYFDLGEKSVIFAVNNNIYNGDTPTFIDNQLKIITTNKKDVFAYGNNKIAISPEEVVFEKDLTI